MMYRFQVCLAKGTKDERWEDVHPKGGPAYEYVTREGAEDMARICYGTDPSLVRVVEVDKPSVYAAEAWETLK
jgi:hypothetical protein